MAGKGYASSTMASLDLLLSFMMLSFCPHLWRTFQSQKHHPLGSAKVFFHSVSSGANHRTKRCSLKMMPSIAPQIVGGWQYRLLPQAAQEATVAARMNITALRSHLPVARTEGPAMPWMSLLLHLHLVHPSCSQLIWDRSRCLICRTWRTQLPRLPPGTSAWRIRKAWILVMLRTSAWSITRSWILVTPGTSTWRLSESWTLLSVQSNHWCPF